MKGWSVTRKDIESMPENIKQQFIDQLGDVKKKNKYGAKKKEYNGRLYDSTGEADYSAQLDLRKLADEIKKIEYQHQIELKENGAHICYYYIDFKVTLSDGSIEFHEFKGKETAVFKLKWKMTKQQLKNFAPNAKLVLVKKIKRQFKTVETYSINQTETK